MGVRTSTRASGRGAAIRAVTGKATRSVIDTTNFNGKGWIATNVAAGWLRGVPQSEACHLVERLTRVDANTIAYELTVDDPTVYTSPWKVAFPLNKDEPYRSFEYACHEGNYALENMLRLGAK
jgi:hypothetical protein